MSHIDMRARHTMSEEDAKLAADELASDLANKFDIDYGWEGDDIHFERSGVHGVITVRENEIRIKAVLGLMLIFLKPRIESGNHRGPGNSFRLPVRLANRKMFRQKPNGRSSPANIFSMAVDSRR